MCNGYTISCLRGDGFGVESAPTTELNPQTSRLSHPRTGRSLAGFQTASCLPRFFSGDEVAIATKESLRANLDPVGKIQRFRVLTEIRARVIAMNDRWVNAFVAHSLAAGGSVFGRCALVTDDIRRMVFTGMVYPSWVNCVCGSGFLPLDGCSQD